MWLNLETGCARSLRVHDGISIEPPDADSRHGRRALVVEAAHSYFPEAVLDDLPGLARAELQQGLTGPLREQLATCQPGDPRLAGLRSDLVTSIGGSADCTGALVLVDHVHLGRLVRAEVPPIITAGCVRWYGHWRTSNAGPSTATADLMDRLARDWLEQPDARGEIDQRIIAEARMVVGDEPADIIDAPI